MQVRIFIESDNDIDVYGPGGYFPAYGPEYNYLLEAPAEEMREKLLMALAQIEIRMPYEKEYNAYRIEWKHDMDVNYPAHKRRGL